MMYNDRQLGRDHMRKMIRENGIDGVLGMIASIFEEDSKNNSYTYPLTFAAHARTIREAARKVEDTIDLHLDCNGGC